MHRQPWLCLALVFTFTCPAAADEPAIAGYDNFDAMTARLHKLARSDRASLTSLGKSRGKRDVWLVTLSQGDPASKPAILVVGNVFAPQLVGSELAVRIAARLASGKKKKADGEDLLERFTVYVIPRPNPDASEFFFHKPLAERAANLRPTDDDRDGEIDEDPANDLNGDGLITMMRVADPTGDFMPHPDDDRVMIKADAKKNERGRYLLYSEGRDDDGDEAWNEDGLGGVDFNRNFTFKYPYFQSAAGPHQVSEAETRAVADFCFAHPNVAFVFCVSPQDNLMHPWKPNTSSDAGKYKTSIRGDDAPLQDLIAEKFREIHGGKNCPDSAAADGSFAHWAYFDYGRWSLASRPWWPPEVAAKKEKPKEGEEKKSAKPSGEKRGQSDVAALRWFAANDIDGFVAWTPIEHPDFPGRTVDVGGFRPFLRMNPPAEKLDPLAEKMVGFLRELPDLAARLELPDAKLESLGAGLFRLESQVVNTGYLPTASAQGQASRHVYPVQLELVFPPGAKLMTGTPRNLLPRLTGRGGHVKKSWVIRTADGKRPKITLKASAPSVGAVQREVK